MLENFDDLFVGDPVQIEQNLRQLLPEALSLEDHSIYLQILSQIALAQALQKKFNEAHETLDNAEKQLTDQDHLAKVRILLERGRVFWQMRNIEAARPLFEQSFQLSADHCFDYHTCNAAHLIAIVAKTSEEKIKWNQIALALAENSQSLRAKAWLGSLYHNLAQAYIEAKQYEDALDAFQKCQSFREKEGHQVNIRVAKWGVARALRFLGHFDEALQILLALIAEYDALMKSGRLDMPIEVLFSARGLVYEELTEIYMAKAKIFSKMAYEDLSKDEWFQKLEPDRLERLRLF